MQRIINDPNNVVGDMLDGFLLAHGDLVSRTHNARVIKYKNAPVKDKVGIVSGGGSGHKPAFVGYVGRNMLDAVAVGEVFSSPTAQAFYDAFRAADAGRGIACLYGNYAGDSMNVKMAVEMAEEDGLTVKTVVANDDVPSAPKDQRNKRRGVAGEVLMWKVGAAKAALGGSLDEVIAVAQKAIDNTRSMGVGLTPCTIPAVGHPNFSIEPGKMEVGIGHHGEPGIKVDDLRPAEDIAKMMLDVILPDLPFASGDRVVALVSGLGATPVMELYIVYRTVAALLEKEKITVHRPYVGNYFTSLDMMGVTLTLMKLDAELEELIDLDVDTMGMTQFGPGGHGAGGHGGGGHGGAHGGGQAK
jgi:phosphoenolpyruvate---glycerone phosphotransferase subunit DhaK